jgi:septum formation protein
LLNNVKKSLILKKKIVLASTSIYRAELLGRLQLPFETVRPDADETPVVGETPAATALRLALLKARSVARRFPDTLIIGSDQVADLAGSHIGKPGTRDRAREQLRRMRGQTLIFHTAVALLDAASGREQGRIVATTVQFRVFSDAQIEIYLDREPALDCAGSAKSEGLGAALIAKMNSDDPTALIGLPLLSLIDMLAAEGVAVLA